MRLARVMTWSQYVSHHPSHIIGNTCLENMVIKSPKRKREVGRGRSEQFRETWLMSRIAKNKKHKTNKTDIKIIIN